ncbi:hypothetical protein [Roseovarius sp.]|uniref:hypothetical protein n=1 Tax=Roseovarius sp. TaxID=1486281 RepID=UPI0026022BB8|nr:hypothetical protein [Roseovarius sp.]
MNILNTRRQMLLGLAAASTAAATGTANANAVHTAENSELIQMGDQINVKLQKYLAARDQQRAIIKEWSPQWPTPDEEIISFGQHSKMYRGIDGTALEFTRSFGVTSTVELGTPEFFRGSYEYHKAEYERKRATKSQRGAKSEKRWMERNWAAIAPSEAYWKEVKRITEVSGIEGATKAKTEAMDALGELVGNIILCREKTVAGLVIKAQALQAWSQVEKFHQMVNPNAADWAAEMAATIVRQISQLS